MYLTTEIESIDGMITTGEVSILEKLKLTKLERDENIILFDKVIEEEE